MSDEDVIRLLEKAELGGWETLNLSDRGLTALPPQIGRLTTLISLDLSGNNLTRLPDEIGRLSKLQSLDLGPARAHRSNDHTSGIGANCLTELPSALFQLTELRFLIVRGNCLTTLQDEIGRLRQLQLLDIGNNRLSTLPDTLAQLENLVTLHADNNAIAALPERSERLGNLSVLELGNNRLTALPAGIGRMTRLRLLDVGNTLSKRLVRGEDGTPVEIAAATNQIDALPDGIVQLPRLAQLFARNNQIARLPDKMAQMKALRHLDLQGNPLPIPPEILAKAYLPHAIIRYHDEAVNAPPEVQLNEAVITVIGPEGAGKSALIERLISERYDANKQHESGLSVRAWHIEGDDQRIRVNFWDGDPGLTATPHQFWSAQRTLYLLVTDARHDETDNRLATWLRLIANFSADAPVIIAHNKTDLGRFSLPEHPLRSKFAQIRAIVPVSVATGDGIDTLQAEIITAIRALEHVDNLIPRSWYQFKLQIESFAAPLLTPEEFGRMASRQAITDAHEQAVLLQFLSDINIVVRLIERKRQEVTHIIKQTWLVAAIYAVLHAPTGGKLTEAHLAEILDPASHPPETHAIILQAMQQLQLGFRHNEQFVVPQQLPPTQPSFTWQPTDPVVLQYRFPVLPHSVVAGVIVKLRQFLVDEVIWRDGALLAVGGCEALLLGDSAENTLTLSAVGEPSAARQLLSLFRTHLDQLDDDLPGLDTQRYVLLPPDLLVGESFDHLLTLEQMGVQRFVPEGTSQTYYVTATLDRIVAPQVRHHAAPAVASTAAVAIETEVAATWETESAERQLIRMRRIRGLVETHARTRANSHFLLLGAAWLIGYLLLLQLDFLGIGSTIIAVLIGATLYVRQARRFKSWSPRGMYTRMLAQQRFDTFAEIDFDDALYRRLENEHGFHDTFL